MRNGVDGMGE